MFCSKCGKEISNDAVICINCGCAVQKVATPATNSSFNSGKKSQVSLVLGIIGIVSAWLFALVGHITSIIGIILGIKEYRETGRMTGLVLSIIGEVCAILSSIIGAVAFSTIY